MENINYFEVEQDQTRKLFDLEEIIDFQKYNDIQLIRGEDYQYSCWINKKAYGSSLTPLFALVVGIKTYKELKRKKDN